MTVLAEVQLKMHHTSKTLMVSYSSNFLIKRFFILDDESVFANKHIQYSAAFMPISGAILKLVSLQSKSTGLTNSSSLGFEMDR